MAHKTAFTRLISLPGLEKLAGERYFKRGLAYFRDGAVLRLQVGADGISARVGGTEPCPYLVRFWIEKHSLKWGCACPLGAGGAFCKHLVATGLAWLSGRVGRGGTTDGLPPAEMIREALKAVDENILARVARRRAAWDESLLAEIALAARASRHRDPAAAAPRKRHASKRKPSSSAD